MVWYIKQIHNLTLTEKDYKIYKIEIRTQYTLLCSTQAKLAECEVT